MNLFTMLQSWAVTHAAFFTALREWATFAADVCILFITIYTFYLTFLSKRMSLLTLGESSSISEGDSFWIVVENRSLSPVVIEDIHLIVDNTHKVQLKKFDEPLILPPFTAQKIASSPYSKAIPPLPMMVHTNVVAQVRLSRKTVYLRMRRATPMPTQEMRRAPSTVSLFTAIYNGKIAPQGASYALVASKGGWQQTSFIFSTGMMTHEVLGYNGLPEEALESQEALIAFLASWLEPSGVTFRVEPLRGFVSDDVSFEPVEAP